MHAIDPDTTLEQLLCVAPEHAPVFENLGVNLRTEGNRSMAQICRDQKLDPQTFARLLAAFEPPNRRRPAAAVELMTLTELCDYIEYTCHRFLRDELARLDQLTRHAAERQGADHPILCKIREMFAAFHERFKAHLRTESEFFFPCIRRLEAERADRRGERNSLKVPAARMEHEHVQADETLAELRAFTRDDIRPLSVRPTLRMLNEAVVRLEQRIHEQIYKENQVLFPRALAISHF